MNLNVSINIVCVVTDISDRHDNLIFYIEYFTTPEIPIGSFTAVKIQYCIVTAFHGVAVNMFIIWLNPLRTKLYLSHLNTQSVPRSKHSVSVIKTTQLMYREIMAVCSEIHTKHKLCGQKVELSVELAVHIVTTGRYM